MEENRMSRGSKRSKNIRCWITDIASLSSQPPEILSLLLFPRSNPYSVSFSLPLSLALFLSCSVAPFSSSERAQVRRSDWKTRISRNEKPLCTERSLTIYASRFLSWIQRGGTRILNNRQSNDRSRDTENTTNNKLETMARHFFFKFWASYGPDKYSMRKISIFFLN